MLHSDYNVTYQGNQYRDQSLKLFKWGTPWLLFCNYATKLCVLYGGCRADYN